MCKKLDKCCCFDLRTGTLIIGVITLVLGILGLIGGVWQLSSKHAEYLGSGIATGITVLEIVAAILLLFGVRQEKSSYLMLWIVLKIISLVFLAIYIILNLIAICAAKKEDLGETSRGDLIAMEVTFIIGFEGLKDWRNIA
uniref:MARVEL domain-containing protein n=1 Tax=Megaselia scalaris TaxID=36166 RepID=T1GWZ1_MEGSC